MEESLKQPSPLKDVESFTSDGALPLSDDSRLDCSDGTKIEVEEKKICPIMSGPVSSRMRVDHGDFVQVVYVDCQKLKCAMWLDKSCGLGLVLNRPPVPAPVVPEEKILFKRERPRSGIGSDGIVNSKE